MDNQPRQGLRSIIAESLRLNLKQYAMFVALAAIWITFTVLTDSLFLSSRNLSNLFVQTVTTAILALGMAMVIISGHIDLSVGSLLGFTGAIAAICMIRLGWGVIPSVLLSLITGLAVGIWHGYWIAYQKVPAFMVSLASFIAFRGLIIGITGGQTQGLEMAPDRVAGAFKLIGQGYLPTIMPAWEGGFHDTSLYLTVLALIFFIASEIHKRRSRIRYEFQVLPLWLYTGRLIALSALICVFASIMIFYLGIPLPVILVVLLAVLFHFIANNTTFGRHLYVIGGNPDAAKLSGINIQRRTMVLFMIMGVMTALAGIVYTARLNAATTSAGQNAEMDAIAAAVIGGASLMGGEGSIVSAVIGSLVITSLDNGMSLMNLDITVQYVVKGLILLLAVWMDIASKKGFRAV